ncbi:hypothetical protein SLE2022_230970 [Rubroshorea leprosula]
MVPAKIEIARKVAGVVGNIASLSLYLSPAQIFIRICKKRAVEHFSPTPYLVMLMNQMVWTLFAMPWVHPNSTLVLTISATGVIIALFFVILFLIYSDRKKRLKVGLVVLLELILVVVLTLVVLTLLHSTRRRSLAVGIIGNVSSIMMYASPFSVMKRVISTKSVEYMPFSLSLASFACGFAWTCYGLLPFDPFICFSSGYGTLLGLGQLILYAIYYKSTKRQMEARQTVEAESCAELGGCH